MSGKKYTREEFAQVLERPAHTNFAFSCRDDFGAYGVVGFGQYRVEGEKLVFTEFAMSCRVAGKYVESAVFAALLRRERCEQGMFDVVITKKNALLRNVLKEIGFAVQRETSAMACCTFGSGLLHAGLVAVEEN